MTDYPHLLAPLDLAEVPESHAGLGRDLTEGPALLQAEVPQNVADFLTNENHENSSSLSSPRPLGPGGRVRVQQQ